MLTRLAIRIQERFGSLTASERALAAHILDHQREVIGLSASEIARGAGVSKSTAARFFRTLGYEDFEAVRRQAREELNRGQPTLGGPSELPPGQPGTSEMYLVQEIANLTRTLEGLSSETLRSATEILARAERVWIAAFGGQAGLARMALQLLGAVRADVLLLDDGVVETVTHLASLRPRDAVLLVSLPPRSRRVGFVLQQAEAAGTGVVVLTDTGGPAPPSARSVIRCHLWSESGRTSLTAVTSIVQLLSARVAIRLGPGAASRHQLVESLREAENGTA